MISAEGVQMAASGRKDAKKYVVSISRYGSLFRYAEVGQFEHAREHCETSSTTKAAQLLMKPNRSNF